MRLVTCDEWHEIETWDEWHEIKTWDEWHVMSVVMMRHEMRDMRWVTCDQWRVINWLWPYTFCEFPFLNSLVNPLLNPFLIPWGQAEWRNEETWDEWHVVDTEMSERHPKTLFLSFWAEGRCGMGISYCERGGQRSPVILAVTSGQRSWAEVKCGHPKVYRQ